MLSRQALFIGLLTLAFAPVAAHAAGLPSGGIVPCNGPDCSVCDLAKLAQNVLNTAIYLAVFLSAVLFAWAGWKYVTAGGNQGEVNKAKEIFWNVTVGLVVILVAWLIVDTLITTLTSITGWNSLCSS